jgi:hypothetical protein
MKVKIFALVAAFFMLMGGSAWAQSDVKGDVNKDGVVNEQDIAAILAIMAKNNGVAEKTKYYWYVGSMSEADALNTTTLGNIVNGKNATSSTTGISTVTIPNDAANEVIVFVYPEIWGRPTIKSENGFGTGDSYYKDEGFELPAGYNASFWPGDQAIKGKTLNITWTK